jgi:hypothetical protein
MLGGAGRRFVGVVEVPDAQKDRDAMRADAAHLHVPNIDTTMALTARTGHSEHHFRIKPAM